MTSPPFRYPSDRMPSKGLFSLNARMNSGRGKLRLADNAKINRRMAHSLERIQTHMLPTDDYRQPRILFETIMIHFNTG